MKLLITTQKIGFMQTYDSARMPLTHQSNILLKKETKAILRDTFYHKNLKVRE